MVASEILDHLHLEPEEDSVEEDLVLNKTSLNNKLLELKILKAN